MNRPACEICGYLVCDHATPRVIAAVELAKRESAATKVDWKYLLFALLEGIAIAMSRR